MSHVVIYVYDEESDVRLIHIGQCCDEQIDTMKDWFTMANEHLFHHCDLVAHNAIVKGSSRDSAIARAERLAEKREETIVSVQDGPCVIEELFLGTNLLVDDGMLDLPTEYKTIITRVLAYENVKIGKMSYPEFEDYMYGDLDFERDCEEEYEDEDGENESTVVEEDENLKS